MSQEPKPLTDDEIERIRISLTGATANADFTWAMLNVGRAIEQLRSERDVARIAHTTFIQNEIERLDEERLQLQKKISTPAGGEAV